MTFLHKVPTVPALVSELNLPESSQQHRVLIFGVLLAISLHDGKAVLKHLPVVVEVGMRDPSYFIPLLKILTVLGYDSDGSCY